MNELTPDLTVLMARPRAEETSRVSEASDTRLVACGQQQLCYAALIQAENIQGSAGFNSC